MTTVCDLQDRALAARQAGRLDAAERSHEPVEQQGEQRSAAEPGDDRHPAQHVEAERVHATGQDDPEEVAVPLDGRLVPDVEPDPLAAGQRSETR